MKEKIKILYIISFLANGGTEKQLMMLVNALDKELYKPYVISLYGEVKNFEDKFECDLISLKIDSMLSLSGFKKIYSVIKFARAKKIDVVQTFFIDPTIIGLFVKFFGGVKLFISSRRDLGFWYTNFKIIILRFINLFTDKIIVNSNAIKQNVIIKEKVPENKLVVVHNGVKFREKEKNIKDYIEKRKELGISNNTKIIGIVGNFNRFIKRYDLFIAVANELLKKRQDLYFLIIGFGDLKSDLEHVIKICGIEQYIKFLGSKEDPMPYISTFDIALNCSDTEGFSNSILEYMSSQKAIVATNNAGNSELIKDNVNGLLVNCGDKEALVLAIMKLLDDENLKEKLATQAKKEATNQYSIENMLNQTVKVIRENL